MSTAAGANWYPMDSRDVASARELLSAAQSTLGNPATLVQKLLGLSADDYQEVVQSLSASGATYVDIVAAYLHNLRVLYDDCGGQFPPELFSTLAAGEGLDLSVHDAMHLASVLPAAGKVSNALHQIAAPQATKPNMHMSQARTKPTMSVNVPLATKYGHDLTAYELLNSPTSTLMGPTPAYSYSSSPTSTSTSSLGSPRDSSPPLLSPQHSWQAQQTQQALWQQAAQHAQQAALEYQNLIAQCSLQMQPATSMAMAQSPVRYSAAQSAHSLLTAQQAALNTGLVSPVITNSRAPGSPQQHYTQQYLDALSSSLQQSGIHNMVEPQSPSMYYPMHACALSAFSPVHADKVACSPNGGLNYDVIKRIWGQ